MAFFGNLGSDSGSSAQSGTWELQMLCSTVPSSEIPALRASQSGTGFENPPPLAISTNLLKFLKCMDLKSVGLGLASIPFRFGWDLVEWNPKLSLKPVDLEVNLVEILEICDEVEEKEA